MDWTGTDGVTVDVDSTTPLLAAATAPHDEDGPGTGAGIATVAVGQAT